MIDQVIFKEAKIFITETHTNDLLSHPSEYDVQFKIFARLWAMATLFHMAPSSLFDTGLNLAFLTVVAFYVIFRPSLAGFIVLIVLQIFDAWVHMPTTKNHWLFTAFVNLTILNFLIFSIIKHRSFNIKEGELFKGFRPIVCVEVVILYFFAIFHKLNAAFFSPDVSCAAELLKAQRLDSLFDLTAGLLQTNIYFTLIAESAIAIMLCFRKTRNTAVMIGLVFHSFLAYSTYNAFYDFSSAMFALYFLFLTPACARTINEIQLRFQFLKDKLNNRFSFTRLICLVLIVALLLGALYVVNLRSDGFQSMVLYFFWTPYSLLLATFFIMHLRAGVSVRPPTPPVRVAHWSLAIWPVLIILNGASPYLGLKTENSFSMFSNLRTEGGKSNHFIVPTYAQVFDYQRDVVEIITSTDSVLQKLANERKALVLFDFRNFVHERAPEKVEYLLNGQRRIFRLAEAGSLEKLGENPYVVRKLMKFRPFSLEEPQQCSH